MKQVEQVLSVEVILDLAGEALPVGRMAWRTSERRSYFEYAAAALDRKLDLSPFNLPLKPVAQAANRLGSGLQHGGRLSA